jgi:hypothetical protein
MSLRWMLNARDTLILEMQRIKDKGSGGVFADEGKTLKDTVDSYLNTFTEVQQKNLKEASNYDGLFAQFQYRQKSENKMSGLSGLLGLGYEYL